MSDLPAIKETAYRCLFDLASEEGIYASGKKEVFGCLFGRDSAITILKLLRICRRKPDPRLLNLCKKTLHTHLGLQGQTVNIESGEEPGKFIHEFRKDHIERFINAKNPWYVYADGNIRNYDSLDSTPLLLIAFYHYIKITGDRIFLLNSLKAVEKGLNWIISYGDRDKDLLVEYELLKERKSGGLPVQSWTDSAGSITDQNGNFPHYPIAPIEVQGYCWLALNLWSDYYAGSNASFSAKLKSQAKKMKQVFNEKFVFKEGKYFFGAQALDGKKNQIRTVTANPLLIFYSAYKKASRYETILDPAYTADFVKRMFQDDLFDEEAGIRTMSTISKTYNPGSDSYHNGSFWPFLNGLIHEGLENLGYHSEAEKLKTASLKPLQYFNTPIELYIKSPQGSYLEYQSGKQTGCRVQAWSAAAILDWLT